VTRVHVVASSRPGEHESTKQKAPTSFAPLEEFRVLLPGLNVRESRVDLEYRLVSRRSGFLCLMAPRYAGPSRNLRRLTALQRAAAKVLVAYCCSNEAERSGEERRTAESP
jgi:hypothetical protein